MTIYMQIIFPKIVFEYFGGYRLHLIRKSQVIHLAASIWVAGLRRAAARFCRGRDRRHQRQTRHRPARGLAEPWATFKRNKDCTIQ